MPTLLLPWRVTHIPGPAQDTLALFRAPITAIPAPVTTIAAPVSRRVAQETTATPRTGTAASHRFMRTQYTMQEPVGTSAVKPYTSASVSCRGLDRACEVVSYTLRAAAGWPARNFSACPWSHFACRDDGPPGRQRRSQNALNLFASSIVLRENDVGWSGSATAPHMKEIPR